MKSNITNIQILRLHLKPQQLCYWELSSQLQVKGNSRYWLVKCTPVAIWLKQVKSTIRQDTKYFVHGVIMFSACWMQHFIDRGNDQLTTLHSYLYISLRRPQTMASKASNTYTHVLHSTSSGLSMRGLQVVRNNYSFWVLTIFRSLCTHTKNS